MADEGPIARDYMNRAVNEFHSGKPFELSSNPARGLHKPFVGIVTERTGLGLGFHEIRSNKVVFAPVTRTDIDGNVQYPRIVQLLRGMEFMHIFNDMQPLFLEDIYVVAGRNVDVVSVVAHETGLAGGGLKILSQWSELITQRLPHLDDLEEITSQCQNHALIFDHEELEGELEYFRRGKSEILEAAIQSSRILLEASRTLRGDGEDGSPTQWKR